MTHKKTPLPIALCACITAIATVLAGCNEFTTEPTRSENARAVQSPPDHSSPISEVYDVQSYATPLASVNTSSNPNVKPQVVTVIDSLIKPGATTKPAPPPAYTIPPGVRFSANPAENLQIKVVQQAKPQDQFAMSTDSDAVPVLTVTSPTGVGSMTIERVGDTWPATVNLHLQNPDGTGFAAPKSFSAVQIVNDQQRIPLKVNNAAGKAQIAIPAGTQGNQIVVDWGDNAP